MAQTVIGVFKNASDASEAKQQLIQEGISSENIDITTSGKAMGGSSTAEVSTETSSSYSNVSEAESFGEKVGHFFKNLFGGDDDDTAEKYSTVAKKGSTLVTVHAASDEQARRAADILDDAGAADVDELANEYGYSAGNVAGAASSSNYGTGAASATDFTTGLGSTTGADYTSGSDLTTATGSAAGLASTSGSTTDYDTNSGSAGYSTSGTTGDNDTLKVIQEDLNVGKKEVVTGGVRLRSRIVERPVQEELRLREETVRVERTPVNRAATEADFQTFQEGEIEMTERAEVPVVAKEARVVEEVSLSKDVNERTETISDTVRNTEVDVENLDKDDVTYRDKNSTL